MSDLDLDLLRCFLTVVESGGFTPASKRLHLTQSAITMKIKRLENLLERRLFFPTSRPLTLSPEGEVVLGYVIKDCRYVIIQTLDGIQLSYVKWNGYDVINDIGLIKIENDPVLYSRCLLSASPNSYRLL